MACVVLYAINLSWVCGNVLLFQRIRLRDNYLVFSGDFNFNHSDFLALINYVSSA